MLQDQRLLELFHNLPTEKQTQVIDFVEKLNLKIEQKSLAPIKRVGSMKGFVLYMAEDFDAPLDDFAEYMQ